MRKPESIGLRTNWRELGKLADLVQVLKNAGVQELQEFRSSGGKVCSHPNTGAQLRASVHANNRAIVAKEDFHMKSTEFRSARPRRLLKLL
jgi:hypothetical protein